MNNGEGDQKPKEKKSSHWVLWALAAIFIFGSITAMMMVDYFFAPDAGSGVSMPKDAADK